MKFSLILILLLSSHAWAKWSVSTYNIRNFDKDPSAGKTDLQELGKIIKSVKSDVMAFEEVVNKDAFRKLMSTHLPDYKFTMSKCGGSGKQSLAIAFDPKVFDYNSETEDLTFSGESTDYCDSLRPVFLVTLTHKPSKQRFTFGVVHLKAGGNYDAMSRRWEQYDKLGRLVTSLKNENVILLGDFNTTGYNLKNEDYEKFEEFLGASGVRTVSETIGCTNYWTGTLGGYQLESSILDHIVLQDKSMRNVKSVKVGAHCAATECRPASSDELGRSYEAVSDHCPVQVTFN